MENEFNERQLQIIDSAIELIGEQGIQGLTIKNLSNEVGITESAIYRHFESKTGILVAVLSYLKDNIVKTYSDILNQNTPSLDKLKKLISNHLKIFNDRPSLTIVLFSDGMYKNEPELTQQILSIMQFVKTSYMMVLDEGKKTKSIRKDISSEHLSFIIMGSIRLSINQWGLMNYSYNLCSKYNELWNTIHKIVKNPK
jgi:AcrR family transcriptional regulator